MDEILARIRELLNRLDVADTWDTDTLIDVKNKTRLYLKKFFKNNVEYDHLLKEIDTDPKVDHDYYQAIAKLKSLLTTLIEDIQLDNKNIAIVTDEERQRILKEVRKEAENERERIQIEAREIQKLKDELQNDRERLMAEEEKFNTFKTKLEVADKELDFQQQAKNNKKTATVWALIGSVLIGILIYILYDNLTITDIFIQIASQVKKGLSDAAAKNEDIIATTIYFTFCKYIFTKLFLYSILIYSIIFCVKNYNAQMHNHIVNTHKSNAFKSTLSLLNTARSDEGNDKLLIQATQAIFSHQQTGYSGKESEPTNPNLVTNIIDSAAKKI